MIRTIEERIVYENRYARIYDDLVEFPGGNRGTYLRMRWTAPHGVAIVPVIGDTILLIETYRYSERAWSLEIPQGFGTVGSRPEDDARRELVEETGLQADRLDFLLCSGIDYVTHGFIAAIAADGVPALDSLEPTESVRRFRGIEIAAITPSYLMAQGVRDAMTLACLLAAAAALNG